ncbi:MAG: GTP cyclohydrolase I FolE [Armatimonadetes bacterium]|nr:GTP cyclohydrolase I FolE [Armatimonadota bacterium]
MDREKILTAVRLFLEGIGEDPQREGLRDTPRRVAAMCEEIFAGIGSNPSSDLRVFHSEDHDEIVLVKDIPFYSLCEHHLLPFIGVAHVAYLPEGSRLLGLSKLARVVEMHAKRLQLQERLTTGIADTIMRIARPRGALCVVEAEHLCMTMRGVKKPGAKTVTSALRGIFRENSATRAEVMTLIR